MASGFHNGMQEAKDVAETHNRKRHRCLSEALAIVVLTFLY
jgi:hypothetical protein